MRVNVHSVHKPNMTFFFQQKKNIPLPSHLKDGEKNLSGRSGLRSECEPPLAAAAGRRRRRRRRRRRIPFSPFSLPPPRMMARAQRASSSSSPLSSPFLPYQ